MSGHRGELVIGMDVGSTTVKAAVIDPVTKDILWNDYQRHHTKQPEKVLELLETILAAFPDQPADAWKMFVTGSGSGPLAPPTGAKFVQEVNAVTLAVEYKHPDVLSVIELGGQDAKIIMFKEDAQTGAKTAGTSMNDKCASGTGRHDRQVYDQGRRGTGLRDLAALQRSEATPRRREVRCVRRDGHRKPGQDGHPEGRGAELFGRRHRAAKPERAHAR